MTERRCYLDANVLIAAWRGDEHSRLSARAALDDPQRRFVVSDLVRLEVLPKPLFYRQSVELTYMQTIFASAEDVPIDAGVIRQALDLAARHDINPLDYRIRDSELAPDAIEHALTELREAWQDSARLLGFLIETLRTKQQRIETLERRLDRIASVVESTRRLRAGETLGDRFRLIREEQRKLDAGEDPLDVVAWVLDDQNADSGRWGEGTVTDPLDDYRL